MVHKRPNKPPPKTEDPKPAEPPRERLAADRLQRQTYPGNQYLVTGGAVGALIIIIAIAVAAGWLTK